MKWHRTLFALALLGLLVSCSNPTVPRFPPEDDETEEEEPPPTQGFVLEAVDLYWV